MKTEPRDSDAMSTEYEHDDDPTDRYAIQTGARLLLAEDDLEMRSLLELTLTREGYEVHVASSGCALLETVQTIYLDAFPSDGIDILITDVRMPGLSGLEAIRRLYAARWWIPTILITAFPDQRLRDEAARLGVTLLAKPFPLRELSHVAIGLLLARSEPLVRGHHFAL